MIDFLNPQLVDKEVGVWDLLLSINIYLNDREISGMAVCCQLPDKV